MKNHFIKVRCYDPSGDERCESIALLMCPGSVEPATLFAMFQHDQITDNHDMILTNSGYEKEVAVALKDFLIEQGCVEIRPTVYDVG